MGFFPRRRRSTVISPVQVPLPSHICFEVERHAEAGVLTQHLETLKIIHCRLSVRRVCVVHGDCVEGRLDVKEKNIIYAYSETFDCDPC